MLRMSGVAWCGRGGRLGWEKNSILGAQQIARQNLRQRSLNAVVSANGGSALRRFPTSSREWSVLDVCLFLRIFTEGAIARGLWRAIENATRLFMPKRGDRWQR